MRDRKSKRARQRLKASMCSELGVLSTLLALVFSAGAESDRWSWPQLFSQPRDHSFSAIPCIASVSPATLLSSPNSKQIRSMRASFVTMLSQVADRPTKPLSVQQVPSPVRIDAFASGRSNEHL